MIPPAFMSLLSPPVTINNFIGVQSVKLPVGSATSAVTFTDIPGTTRVTAMFTNSGSNGCYLAAGTASVQAVVSTVAPSPSSATMAYTNCHYVAAGSIQILDFAPGVTSFAAISGGTATISGTVLEITSGYGN